MARRKNNDSGCLLSLLTFPFAIILIPFAIFKGALDGTGYKRRR